jgi:hypothetical protein
VRTTKGWVCLLLVLCMVAGDISGLFPGLAARVTSAAAGPANDEMNALSALGIDTSVMPEGFDPDSTDNPYGRNTTRVNPVLELFVDRYISGTRTGSLYGHGSLLGDTNTAFYSTPTNQLTSPDAAEYDAYRAASGDFTGSGLKGQVVTVAAYAQGGVYLYFTDPLGAMGTNTKTIMDSSKSIGNTGKYAGENLTEFPYQLQNYLQVISGDFDGDGFDEVAVYVPEQNNNSRVAVYKLQFQQDDLNADGTVKIDVALDASNWALMWTYALQERTFVSNMVSLTAGDMTMDGVDDLAITWGVYYGPSYKTNCQAVVLHGSKTGTPLQTVSPFDLTYGTSKIVRAALTFGDADGDGKDELVMGGQLEVDIDAGEMNTRVISVYDYAPLTGFVRTASSNAELIERDDNGNLVAPDDGYYFSSPGCVANIACVKMNGVGTQEFVYLDSVIYLLDGGEFKIQAELDELAVMKDPTRILPIAKYYSEYGVIAADFNGDGKETIQVMQLFPKIDVTWGDICPSAWWWLLGIWKDLVLEGHPNAGFLRGIYAEGDGDSGTILANTTNIGETLNTAFCAPDTDIDTTVLRYTGRHDVVYTDPKVLAVVSSPPYFADLEHLDGGDSYVGNSDTSYATTKGSSQSGSVESDTVTAGAYVSFEQEFNVFGVVVAKFEMELEYKHGWTWETEQVSVMEQTVEYGTGGGADVVAFYSIPMEVYVYDAYIPVEADGDIVYEKQTMTVNIPHTAVVKTLDLEDYEAIAADYDELPKIAGTVITHTVGDPSTYPTSTAKYSQVNQYDGDFAGVAYNALGYVSQQIDITDETTTTTSQSNSIEFKIGGGAFGVCVGVVAGYEGGSGTVKVDMTGSSFSGTVVNMPSEAQGYGYNYAWKIFQYTYTNGDVSFPVVDYLVTDVSSPPKIPTDFSQNTERTTADKVVLSWTCNDHSVGGYQVYRHYDFPDGSGDYPVGDIISSEDFEILRDENNEIVYDDLGNAIKAFYFEDTGLSPYTEYEYRIRAIGAVHPTDSVLSPVLTARAKASEGNPVIGLSTTDLLVYPDKDATVVVYVENAEDYTQGALFQWQKMVDGKWTDIIAATKATLTFRSAGLADEGKYRCRVNVIYGDYYISAYSDIVDVSYCKRTPKFYGEPELTVTPSDTGGPTLQVTLRSTHSDSGDVPRGTVVFEISGTDYFKSYAATVQADPVQGVATCATTPLPNGIYSITAYYSGNRVFKSIASETRKYLSGVTSGYWLEIAKTHVYGDQIAKELNFIEQTPGGVESTEVTENVTFKVTTDVIRWEEVRFEFLGIVWFTYWSPVLETVPVEGWVAEDGVTVSANTVGTFTLNAYLDGHLEASEEFSVTKRPVTIVAPTLTAMAGTPEAVHPGTGSLEVSSGSLAPWDTLESLDLQVQCLNSAGNKVTIVAEGPNATEPGNYTTIPTSDTGGLVNYDAVLVPGLYTLVGETFQVTGVALPLLGKDAGSISVLSPAGHQYWTTQYQAGTEITFTASPLQGYQVAEWYVNGAPMDNATNRLHYIMTSEPLEVQVEFKVASTPLVFANDPGDHGQVVCVSSDLLQSGATVIEGAEYTFKAIPDEGYHFLEWRLYTYGTSYPEGDLDPEGFHTYTLTMGNVPTRLLAVFERDSYTLTLGDHLEASYMYDHDHIVTTPDIEAVVSSGASIPGDTVVTVRAVAGYRILPDELWYVDGQPVVATPDDPGTPDVDETVYYSGETYEFPILSDTTVSVATELQHYGVTTLITEPEDASNSVTVTVNGVSTSLEALSDIEGGSRLVFTATPAYGYVFDKWVMTDLADGTSSDILGDTLTISTLDSDMLIEAVFLDNTLYTVAVSVGIHGSLSYSLNGGPDVLVPGNASIPVFEGDDLVFKATPDTNYMVGIWTIDGVPVQTTDRTWRFDDIADDIVVDVSFTAMSYYTVNFSVGEGGTVSAVLDGTIPLRDGDNPGGGSIITFSAIPDPGKMLEKWTVNGVDLTTAHGAPYVVKSYTIGALSRNTNVVVMFCDEVMYTVTVDQPENGEITAVYTPDDYSPLDVVRAGASAVFTVVPDAGCRIKDVSIYIGGDQSDIADSPIEMPEGSWVYTIVGIEADISIQAQILPVYSISVAQVTGGRVDLSATSGFEGATITVNATPSTFYRFDGWKVTYGDGIEVPVTDKAAATTTFNMPAGNVLVTPTFTYSGGGDIPGPIPMLYTIEVSSTEGGTVSPWTSSVIAGTAKTFEILPDPGYVVYDVWVDGVSIGPVESYTFEKVTKNTSIRAIFQKAAPWQNPFADVLEGAWYFDAVRWAVENGLFQGTGENTFEPNTSMTRAMFVTVLSRLAGVDPSGFGNSFSDVDPDTWFTDAVAWAAANGIVSGVGDGRFGPGLAITREQMAVMLFNYAKYAGLDEAGAGETGESGESDALGAFVDHEDISGWAKDALAWAVEKGLLNGKEDNLLDPQGTATRAEVAAFLQRFVEMIER